MQHAPLRKNFCRLGPFQNYFISPDAGNNIYYLLDEKGAIVRKKVMVSFRFNKC
jgi:hypothetical protein